MAPGDISEIPGTAVVSGNGRCHRKGQVRFRRNPAAVPGRALHLKMLFFAVALIFFAGNAFAGPFLPVHVEDNHAGSFYWLARNLNWSEKYQLILFDRHSDATSVFDSDFIRNKLNARQESADNGPLFLSWKEKGIIQCYNWIEPLLPHPIYRVTWVPGERFTRDEIEAKKTEVADNINQYISAVPRSSGNLSNIYTVRDFATQKNQIEFPAPVIVSVDLDYFVDVPADELDLKFSELLDYVLRIKQLSAITVAISRPYLKSEEQANHLLFIALKYLSSVINAEIDFEPFSSSSYGPDRSELAKSFYQDGIHVPSFNIREASATLISLILSNPSRYAVHFGTKTWNELLANWAKGRKQPVLVLSSKGHALPDQACHFFPYKKDFTVSIKMPFIQGGNNRIRWEIVSPSAWSFNILGRKEFAGNAPGFVEFRAIELTGLRNQRTIRSAQLKDIFDERTGFGTVRLFAEVMRNGASYRTRTICIARYANAGYPGRLTEIFNLPYILGSGLFKVDGLYGADAHYGADCLNFIIYGRRRMGKAIPYLNGNDLRAFLTKVDDVVCFKGGIGYNRRGKIAIDDRWLKDGLLLHFGTHIAALYQDNEPKNILNEDDLVIHQLENKAEIVKLKELKQARKPFVLMRFK
jgi:hypothetical protein